MKSIFDDLDQLIEQAVAHATNTEKSLQQNQIKNVKKRNLEANKKSESDDVDEADEDKKDNPDDESIKKIKGKTPDEKVGSSTTNAPDKSTPGTQTSKKLANPSEKTLANPNFNDISKKINVLRGSGSLKDEKVSSAVKTYLGTLSPAEKSALLTYLTSLAQIMTSIRTPEDVNDPSDVGIKTHFKKSSNQKEMSVSSSKIPEKQPGIIVVGGK